MIHAKDEDFDNIMEIVYSHKKWFGHIRTDYIRQMIIPYKGKLELITKTKTSYDQESLIGVVFVPLVKG
jgi:hypothetical protein|tara:strand:+ start:269 stop:475 length:207 start_codon:yes stop_codon:yes gene_type:complete